MKIFNYLAPEIEIVELAAEAAYCLAASVDGENTEQWIDKEF